MPSPNKCDLAAIDAKRLTSYAHDTAAEISELVWCGRKTTGQSENSV